MIQVRCPICWTPSGPFMDPREGAMKGGWLGAYSCAECHSQIPLRIMLDQYVIE